ncbi:MAG TPA: hypothetical protein VN963_03435 [bacterium]|nr:hypothetical protein [bacterium]
MVDFEINAALHYLRPILGAMHEQRDDLCNVLILHDMVYMTWASKLY